LNEPALKKKGLEKNTFIRILNIIDASNGIPLAAWTNQTEKPVSGNQYAWKKCYVKNIRISK